MAQSTGKAQPAPAKHIPQRMCIACRETDAKRELVRVVRTADGRVQVDLSGKARGRGAYVCRNPACWTIALQRRALERALRLERLHPDDQAALQAFGAALQPVATAPESATP